MARVTEETGQFESNTIGVFRSAATVKGGRRFSFGSLVVVGDRTGRVGLGYAKANEVPPAIEKAGKDARKNMKPVTLQGTTIPHEVVGRYSSSKIKLIPASPGTGIVAGSTVRAVLEMAGVSDCMTKSYGSNNKKNLAKATLDGLTQLRSKATIEGLRGLEVGRTEVDERIERGSAFLTPAAKPAADTTDSKAERTDQTDAPKKTNQAEGEPKDTQANAAQPNPESPESPATTDSPGDAGQPKKDN